MLPDYPHLKEQLRAELNLLLQMAVNLSAPLAGSIRSYRQVEGDRFTYETTEGQVVTKKFLKFSSKVEVPAGLSASETHQRIMEESVKAAKDIAQQSEGLLFSTLDETTREVGNAFDAGGKPFDPNMFWEMLEKTDMDFDEKTEEPHFPTICMHPDMMKSIAPKIPEWEADPRLQARRAEVLRTKKEEWRDRESRRKLVG
jgi:hypothetical protein